MNSSGKNGTSNGASTTLPRGRMLIPAPDSPAAPVELSDLARELAADFARMVNYYRKHYKLSAEEAVARTEETPDEHFDRILHGPPDQLTWLDLDALAHKDEQLTLNRWDEIKEAARNEIRSGHRAACAVEDGGGPWERARFLAVRSELTEAWHPRNASEQFLVDQLAQWQILLWRWQAALSTWTTLASDGSRRAKKGQPYETMRLSDAEALERAAAKVERLHGLYLRTLKALQDQRKPLPLVGIQHAEQVNISPIRISVGNVGLLPQDNEDPS
jgi:hypothetical protein